jgi:hypothetical protein
MGDSPFIQFIATLNSGSIWVLAKIVYLIAFLIYALFSLVIVTQVSQMKKNITMGLEFLILPAVWLHLAVAVLAFVLAFMLL